MSNTENTAAVVATETDSEVVMLPKAEYDRLKAQAQAKTAKSIRVLSVAQVGNLTKAVGRYARELEEETEVLRKSIEGGNHEGLDRFNALTDGIEKARELLNNLRTPESRIEEAKKIALAKEKQKAKLAEKAAQAKVEGTTEGEASAAAE